MKKKKVEVPETLEEMQVLLQSAVSYAPYGKKLWDLMTCLRGPDSPSERPDQGGEENSRAYQARRTRKAKTVEVIRGKFVVGGSARFRQDRDFVELPPEDQWDHFDRHVEKAANALGLEVRIEKVNGIKVKEVVKNQVGPMPGPIKKKKLKQAATDWENWADAIGKYIGEGALIPPMPDGCHCDACLAEAAKNYVKEFKENMNQAVPQPAPPGYITFAYKSPEFWSGPQEKAVMKSLSDAAELLQKEADQMEEAFNTILKEDPTDDIPF